MNSADHRNLTGQENMKNNIKLASLVAVVFLVGMGNFAGAAEESDEYRRMDPRDPMSRINEKKAQREDRINEKVCNKIDDMSSRLENKLTGDGGQVKEKMENKLKEMKDNRTSRDTELENRRNMRDENRSNFYEELEAKVGDDAVKKAAVEKFKTTVEEAIKTRRAAIDQAREIMNKGIDESIGKRESSMDALRVEFKNKVMTKISEAKNSCDDDMSADELKRVMTQLKNDIKSVREEYKNKVTEVKKVQETIQALRDTRKESVKLAIENFKTTMKTAQEELRKVMGA